MEITVSRKWKTEKSSIDRNPKEKKIYGMTAIPKGKYEIAITFSNKFQTYLPLLLKVPNYEGVRIHPGNTDADTLGCILVGLGKGKDMITESRKAFSVLFKKMQAVAKKEKIFITIK
jgi:Family of unknown function (DUF5675)